MPMPAASHRSAPTLTHRSGARQTGGPTFSANPAQAAARSSAKAIIATRLFFRVMRLFALLLSGLSFLVPPDGFSQAQAAQTEGLPASVPGDSKESDPWRHQIQSMYKTIVEAPTYAKSMEIRRDILAISAQALEAQPPLRSSRENLFDIAQSLPTILKYYDGDQATYALAERVLQALRTYPDRRVEVLSAQGFAAWGLAGVTWDTRTRAALFTEARDLLRQAEEAAPEKDRPWFRTYQVALYLTEAEATSAPEAKARLLAAAEARYNNLGLPASNGSLLENPDTALVFLTGLSLYMALGAEAATQQQREAYLGVVDMALARMAQEGAEEDTFLLRAELAALRGDYAGCLNFLRKFPRPTVPCLEPPLAYLMRRSTYISPLLNRPEFRELLNSLPE